MNDHDQEADAATTCNVEVAPGVRCNGVARLPLTDVDLCVCIPCARIFRRDNVLADVDAEALQRLERHFGKLPS